MTILARLALGFCVLLEACASGPPTRLFLLAAPTQDSGLTAGNTAPVQLQTVVVPDYLDTTDILTRSGPHEITASQTGRWGERLSEGITHALQADLVARVAGRLTLNPPANPAAAQLVVTVDAFDAWPDGHCALTAHWTILRNAADAVGRSGQGSFISSSASGTDDAARVAKMADAVEQLSRRIATERGLMERKQGLLF